MELVGYGLATCASREKPLTSPYWADDVWDCGVERGGPANAWRRAFFVSHHIEVMFCVCQCQPALVLHIFHGTRV